MTAPIGPDPDRLIQALLEIGPDVLPDRVFQAVVDDVHQVRQRASFGPWRIQIMSRFSIIATGLVTIAVVGAVAFALSRPSNLGGPSATASPTPTPAPPTGLLEPGATYAGGDFSQPLTFVIPALPPALDGDLNGDLVGPHMLRIRPHAGAVTILDDAKLFADPCHPDAGDIADEPSTPDAVAAWLANSSGLEVSAPIELTVDGRAARAWDVGLSATCWDGSSNGPGPSTSIFFSAMEHHRVYAVPTGQDTIVIFTWGAGYGGEGEGRLSALNTWTDQLVASMRFE